MVPLHSLSPVVDLPVIKRKENKWIGFYYQKNENIKRYIYNPLVLTVAMFSPDEPACVIMAKFGPGQLL